MMNFDQTPEFKKDIKALSKRVPTLISDIDRVKKRIEPLYVERPGVDLAEFHRQFFSGKNAAILPSSTEDVEIIKMRLDTDTTQYRQKLRLVFIAVRQGDTVVFIELYSKSDKDREDSKRIRRYVEPQ